MAETRATGPQMLVAGRRLTTSVARLGGTTTRAAAATGASFRPEQGARRTVDSAAVARVISTRPIVRLPM